MEYREYLESHTWQATRLRRLRLCEWNGYGWCRCEKCRTWTHQSQIDVHHVSYERLGRERMSDLDVLCRSCHAAAHGRPEPGSMADLMLQLLERLDVQQGYRKVRA